MKPFLPLSPGIVLLCLWAGAAQAQIETMPLDAAPVVQERTPPPVLPQHPRRAAISSIANGGSGGMSYSGPSGAMNTSPEGASCAVTCATRPRETYSIECPAGNTAYCQCDSIPYAACLAQ